MHLRVLFLSILLGSSLSATANPPHTTTGELEFVANKGQWPAVVQYRTQLPNGGTLWVQPNSYRLSLQHPHDTEWIENLHQHDHEGHDHNTVSSLQYRAGGSRPIRFEALDVKFVGGEADLLVQEDVLDYHHNYFLGQDRSRWASDVPVSRSVLTQEIYPGIDLRWYSEAMSPKYDWVLAQKVVVVVIQHIFLNQQIR
ncbi:MAG: hypothetical protein AAFQ98_26380, partial [Bacteroidota bacterium]